MVDMCGLLLRESGVISKECIASMIIFLELGITMDSISSYLSMRPASVLHQGYLSNLPFFFVAQELTICPMYR